MFFTPRWLLFFFSLLFSSLTSSLSCVLQLLLWEIGTNGLSTRITGRTIATTRTHIQSLISTQLLLLRTFMRSLTMSAVSNIQLTSNSHPTHMQLFSPSSSPLPFKSCGPINVTTSAAESRGERDKIRAFKVNGEKRGRKKANLPVTGALCL